MTHRLIFPFFLLAILSNGCPGFTPDPGPVPDPEPSPVATGESGITGGTGVDGTPPALIYGITIDDASQASAVVQAFSGYPVKPWVRVVFDEGTAPEDYVGAIGVFRDNHFPILGELLDSFFMDTLSVPEYRARAVAFMNKFQGSVAVWEIGNEVGGSWLGGQVGEKVAAAFDYAKLRGLKTAVTGYYCVDSGTMVGWLSALKNVPERMRSGLDYVFISYYERDCGGGQVKAEKWNSEFDDLGVLFPNARLGFGETGIGTVSESNNAEYGTDVQKADYMRRYYGMSVHHSRYVLGGFWWWGLQDLVPSEKPLNAVFRSVVQ